MRSSRPTRWIPTRSIGRDRTIEPSTSLADFVRVEQPCFQSRNPDSFTFFLLMEAYRHMLLTEEEAWEEPDFYEEPWAAGLSEPIRAYMQDNMTLEEFGEMIGGVGFDTIENADEIVWEATDVAVRRLNAGK